MRNAGFFLMLLGAVTFLFPLIGYHSMILGIFGEYEKIAAGASLGLGAVLFALSFRKNKEEKK
jgi:hypothetical protein